MALEQRPIFSDSVTYPAIDLVWLRMAAGCQLNRTSPETKIGRAFAFGIGIGIGTRAIACWHHLDPNLAFVKVRVA